MAGRQISPWFGGFGRELAHPFGHLQSGINRLFEEMWRDFDMPASDNGLRALAPRVDVSENEDGYRIAAELPGLSEDDVEVTVADGVLTLKGEKKAESSREEQGYHISERRFGSFERRFRLPVEADADGISAEFDKGVLNVHLPKRAEARQQVKKIAVRRK